MDASPDTTLRPRPVSGALPGFVLLYVALYAAYGTESAYFPAFLRSHGLPVERIGLVLSIGTLVRIVAGPAVGRLADQVQARRAVLASAATLSGCISFAYLAAFGFVPLLLVSMTHAAATASLSPLSDALAVAAAKGPRPFQYGWVRGAGSAAFVAGTLLSGQFVDRLGLGCIIVASGTLFLAMGGVTLRLGSPASRAGREDSPPGDAFRSLWRIPVYRWLIGIVALVAGSHALNDAFAVISWRQAGLGSGAISVLWSESVVAEVAMFFALGPWLLGRIGPARALALSAAAGLVRWGVLGWTTSIAALVCVQALHGFTFALLHLAAMTLIGLHVPDRLAATAQSVYGTIGFGVASAALTFASGYLFGAFGLHAFWVMSLLCALALPLTFGLASRTAGGGSPLAGDARV